MELANSARAAAHLGMSPPTSDIMIWGSSGDCELVPAQGYPGLYQIPASSAQYTPGLYTPPDGSARYDPGLLEVGDCWRESNLCMNCSPTVLFDDSWDGLREFLGDTTYRPELAPWYQADVPASAEFGGVWVLEAKGFDSVPMARPVTELAGPGGAAGLHRDTSRPLQVSALLFACTNAGLEYGLTWLDCQLRETNDRTDSVLRYLAAHPKGSRSSAEDLVRELHGVVLTKNLVVDTAQAAGRSPHATMCTVSWEMTALHPYSYRPVVIFPVVFDSVTLQPIEWVHGAQCDEPSTCAPMAVLFGEECVPEAIDIVTTPPPTCGGCLPVCGVQTSVFVLDGPQPQSTSGSPVSYPSLCRSTAVSWSIVNHGTDPLTVQTYWRACVADPECEETAQWPTQITGLPTDAILTFDAVRRRYWVNFAGHASRDYRPVGMVSTPRGSPWEPAVLDRARCWEFVVQAPEGADFEVTMRLYDREA